LSKKILIVDDEPFVVETLKFSLEQAGFHCLAAYDGGEAIEKVRREEPDLVLLDIVLPKIDGFRVCRLIKSDERYRHIPVIMMSSRVQEKDWSSVKDGGAEGYLVKPFKMEELIGMIHSYLQEEQVP
jgi:DNA-binding response OmpR family regulator